MTPIYTKVKETFSQLCASEHLTVSSKHLEEMVDHQTLQIVTTSQLSIRMINADGSSGSYDSGAHGILSPYLGIATLWR